MNALPNGVSVYLFFLWGRGVDKRLWNYILYISRYIERDYRALDVAVQVQSGTSARSVVHKYIRTVGSFQWIECSPSCGL